MARPVRLLYAAPKYDYGDPARGLSFTHHNFFETLRDMGLEIVYFDGRTMARSLGPQETGRRLLQTARDTKPDAAFFCVHEDEFLPADVQALAALGVPTVNWFTDDHWRFERFSARWASSFSLVVTTDAEAVPKYHALGVRSVLRSQWGVNPFQYVRSAVPKTRQVAFVGQPYGDRERMVARLRSAGVEVECFGHGWPAGRISQERMLQVFNETRINLNFSASAMHARTPRARGWRKWRRRLARWAGPLGSAFGGGAMAGGGRAEPAAVYPPQVKGRHFELPGIGAFMLTDPVPQLAPYLTESAEYVAFRNADDLVEKARLYLADESARARIADAAYRRCAAEHTYVHRFCEVFARLGVPLGDPAVHLAGGARPGPVHEVAFEP